jgi:hypothetical protein
MQRRDLCLAIAIGGAAVGTTSRAWAQTGPDRVLSLYGIALKDADARRFLDAAVAAGGVPLAMPAGAPPTLDMRGAGVPALQRLTLATHDGKVARVQFLVKGYGEDNVELRRLLMGKYGVPMTVSARPLAYGGFGDRAAPRGGFQWRFADGMVLVYDHPRIGDVTLSYGDEARLSLLGDGTAAPPAPPADNMRNRF